MSILNKKIEKLYTCLKQLSSVVIAYSGGVDSAALTAAAYRALGKNAVAVTACSPTYTNTELRRAKKIAKQIGICHRVVHTDEFRDARFIRNHHDRCYWCKRALWQELTKVQNIFGFKHIVDGTNADDSADIRPGTRAKKEFSVVSPFLSCNFSKEDIRVLARRLRLPVWNAPAAACLASRIPFGESITPQRLARIEHAERILRSYMGPCALIRARDHENLVRIELHTQEWTKLLKSDINRCVVKLKKLGYRYVVLDLEGYIPAGIKQSMRAGE